VCGKQGRKSGSNSTIEKSTMALTYGCASSSSSSASSNLSADRELRSAEPMEEDNNVHMISHDGNLRKEDDDIDNNDSMECPLFMTGLPSNFGNNHHLAALGSLLNCSEEEEKGDSQAVLTMKKKDEQVVVVGTTRRRYQPVSGGGKARKMPICFRRGKRAEELYQKPKTNQNSKAAVSLGETQLFLTMWKI